MFIKTLVLSSTLFVGSVATAATPPQKIVFYGDEYTANWPLPSNWINKGVPGYDVGPGTDFGLHTGDALADFQSAVVSLHPTIVHLMVGSNDVNGADDATTQFTVPGYMAGIAAIVKEAKAANIQVILGNVIPAEGPGSYMNAALSAFGAANGIQVINYSDLLCGCVSGVGGAGYVYVAPTTPAFGNGGSVAGLLAQIPDTPIYLPTAAGYALMTQMAQTAISALGGVTLKSGWLQNNQLPNPDIYNGYLLANLNTVNSAESIQFTPIGLYSDGSQRPMLNSTYSGFGGTWTTSNPQAMSVSQNGLAKALIPGTAIIKYTAPNGVQFSEWIMYVVPFE